MNILILLPNKVEEIEFITALDIWRRAEYNVTTASINEELLTISQKDVKIYADTTLRELKLSDFDCLFLPGGAGHKLLEESSLVQQTIKYFIENKKMILAICASAAILHPWLQTKKATCYPTYKDLLPSYQDQEVVIDLPFITSQGAGTASDLAFTLVSHIDGAHKCQELKNIMRFFNSK